MSVTSRDIIAWVRWARAGATESERNERAAHVHRHIFPDGIGLVEKSMREWSVDYVEYLFKDGEPASWEGYPEPRPPGDEKEPPPKVEEKEKERERPVSKERWTGLISPDSPAFRRASRRDGTAVAHDEIRAAARGSPFFDAPKVDRSRRRG